MERYCRRFGGAASVMSVAPSFLELDGGYKVQRWPRSAEQVAANCVVTSKVQQTTVAVQYVHDFCASSWNAPHVRQR